MRNFRKICPCCHKVFAFERPDQTFCSYLCEKHSEGITSINREYGKEYKKCIKCGNKFHGYIKTKNCSEKCRLEGLENKKYTNIIKDNKLKNERWTKDKPKKKVLPLEVQNKMAEYKRVFDEKGWDHYLRGRKWDRI